MLCIRIIKFLIFVHFLICFCKQLFQVLAHFLPYYTIRNINLMFLCIFLQLRNKIFKFCLFYFRIKNYKLISANAICMLWKDCNNLLCSSSNIRVSSFMSLLIIDFFRKRSIVGIPTSNSRS